MTHLVSRRMLLRRALAAATAGLCDPGRPRAAPASSPLRWTVPFGAAVRTGLLASDPAYRRAVLAFCRIVVPEGGLKWADIRPARDAFRFEEGDAFVRFARDHGLAARGHTLVWADAMPSWTAGVARGEAEAILVDHVSTVVGRYAGRIGSWDVVNEPLAAVPRDASDLRDSIWLARLGPDYIETALRAAAAADPAARLVINDYDIEFVGEPYRTKRSGLLALLRGLRDRGVPLHGVGLQGHLRGEREIDTDGVSAFVGEVSAMGLEVSVTELDVIDDRLPGPDADRDEAVASKVSAFLGAVFAGARPAAVLTWGITDRYTWVPMYYRRADGRLNRPLPLDADYRQKPFMATLERFCR